MKNLTTKLSLAAALTLVLSTFGAPLAQAEEAVAEHAVTFNAAITSDYRYRGLSQTKLKPALQGGADYTHTPTGLYAGVWASTIKWTGDLGADGDVEIDLYGGKRGELGGGLTYDVGGLYYAYPSYDLEPDANTFEVYGQLGYGPAYIKYSHSTTNLFGTADTKGSGYVDLGANVEITTGLMLNLHAGRQIIKNYDDLSYNDYKIGITKDFGFATLAVAAIKADTNMFYSPSTGKNLARTGAVVTLSKTF
jgi:uncharacterized protein (TIGR02001 family)